MPVADFCTAPARTVGGVLSISTGELTRSVFARGFGRIRFTVGSRDAEEVFAIGQCVAIHDQRVVVQVGAQRFPLALSVAAELHFIDEAVAIGIVGLP